MFRSFCFIGLLLLTACSQQEKDKGIRQMIGAQAKEEIAFADVQYSVVNGVVTLRGACATEKEKGQVESEVKQTAGVKDVINQITVAPVTLNGEHLLKKDVDSVLMDYPAVEASIKDGVVYLQGQVDKKSEEKLLRGLTALKVKNVNQLTVAAK